MDGRLVVTDQTSRVVHVDLRDRSVRSSQVRVPAFSSLVHPRIQPGGSLCAAGTRTLWVSLWNFEDFQAAEFAVDHAVQSVAFSPTGSHLLVGTGMYPLSRSSAQARLHLFELPIRSKEPVPEVSLTLPGCSVDCLDWTWTSNVIVAVVGFPDQKQGLVVRVDPWDLRPLQYDHVPQAMALRVSGSDLSAEPTDGSIAVSYTRCVRGARSSDVDAFGWRDAAWKYPPEIDESVGRASAVWLEEQNCWLVNDGWMLNGRGEKIERLSPLTGCVDLTPSWRGAAGVNLDGHLRYWASE